MADAKTVTAARKALKKGEVLIRFTSEKVIEDEHEGTEGETRFQPGDLLPCSPTTAGHFVSRGVAERV